MDIVENKEIRSSVKRENKNFTEIKHEIKGMVDRIMKSPFYSNE